MPDSNSDDDSPIRLPWPIHGWILAPTIFEVGLHWAEKSGFRVWVSETFQSFTGQSLPDHRETGLLLLCYLCATGWTRSVLIAYQHQTKHTQPRWITLGVAVLIGAPMLLLPLIISKMAIPLLLSP